MPFDAALQLPDHRAGRPRRARHFPCSESRRRGPEPDCRRCPIRPAARKRSGEPSWSLVPTAKCGLSRVTACQYRSFSRPPPPALVGLYGHRGRGHRHPGLGQHHAGHRRRQADGDHPLDKGPPRQSAGLDVCNQVSKFPLLHRFGSSLVAECRSPRLLPPQKPGATGNGSGQDHPVKAGSRPLALPWSSRVGCDIARLCDLVICGHATRSVNVRSRPERTAPAVHRNGGQGPRADIAKKPDTFPSPLFFRDVGKSDLIKSKEVVDAVLPHRKPALCEHRSFSTSTQHGGGCMRAFGLAVSDPRAF